jgi:Ca2+-binding RTX toxin-like protein
LHWANSLPFATHRKELPVRQNTLLRRAFFEPLESRRLLAIDLNSGVLSIVGTNKNDTILVDSDGTNVTVHLGTVTQSFLATDVTSITVNGQRGNDRIEIGNGVTVGATLLGGDGNDRLFGGNGNDILDGGRGNDTISGGGGNDTISGGGNHDVLYGGAGDDLIHGNGDADFMWGGNGDDLLFGDAGNDKLFGDAGDDTLDGAQGNDHLHGGADDDQLLGAAGNDQIFGDDGNDFLDGGLKNDTLRGGNGNDILSGGSGNDRLWGGTGTNFLDGGSGHNVVREGQVVNLGSALVAQMSNGSGATATARFEFSTEGGNPDINLTISVSGATAGTSLPVTINGMAVGSMLTDGSGNGELHLSSNPEDADELPWPTGLVVTTGSTISIGSDLSGTFVLEP